MKRMLYICQSCQHIKYLTDDDAYTVIGIVKEDINNRRYYCSLNIMCFYRYGKQYEELEVPDKCPMVFEQMVAGQMRK